MSDQPQSCRCEPHVARWNKAGYDDATGCRCLYLFLDPDDRLVKLGLVLHPPRVEQRRRPISGGTSRPGLTCVAQTTLHNVNHQVAEHLEAVARHWLYNAHGFEHAGLVDWLKVPDAVPADWQVLLDDAVAAAMSFGRNSG